MCEQCNLEDLTPEQLEMVSGLSADVRNSAMLLRHLRRRLRARVQTKVVVQDEFTHGPIPVGTFVVLERIGCHEQAGGTWIGTIDGKGPLRTWFGDWFDLTNAEWLDTIPGKSESDKVSGTGKQVVGRYVRVKSLNKFGAANWSKELMGVTYYHVALNNGSVTQATIDDLEILY